jgi:N-acetylneuraminic acid mutarotase
MLVIGLLTLCNLGLHGCGGDGDGPGTLTESANNTGGGTTSTTGYTVGGSIGGLISSGLVLANGTGTVSPQAGTTSFSFTGTLQSGATYAVSVQAQPAGEVCQITDGTGTVASASITNVAVTCTREWTWVNGADTANGAGVYGAQGVAAAANVPGARQASVSWTDSGGNLWLFGGTGLNTLNDLWKYSPGTGEWTWMGGSDSALQTAGVYGTRGTAAASNMPGARAYSAAWTDAAGNLWLFGGSGYGADGAVLGSLNDLWMYAVSSGEWTWVSGSTAVNSKPVYGTQGVAAATNVPGARAGSVAWFDATGNLWLFGGSGYDANGASGLLNDLWQFSPSSGQWTWMSGANVQGRSGSYGTQGAAATTNLPGSRQYALSWADSSGNLWLFGGNGYDSNGSLNPLNDLWRYNTSTNQWTWVGGSNIAQAMGAYGTLGMAAATNVPGAREAGVSWIDGSGTLWLFGGLGYAGGGSGTLNDLWSYSPSAGQWTWVDGANTANALGAYGTQNMAAVGNAPDGRNWSASWIDGSGHLWLFGGFAQYAAGKFGVFNDLWRY